MLGLNENISHRPMCLNTWSPLGGVFGEVVEMLGGGSLLEEIHNGGGVGWREQAFERLQSLPGAWS